MIDNGQLQILLFYKRSFELIPFKSSTITFIEKSFKEINS